VKEVGVSLPAKPRSSKSAAGHLISFKATSLYPLLNKGPSLGFNPEWVRKAFDKYFRGIRYPYQFINYFSNRNIINPKMICLCG